MNPVLLIWKVKSIKMLKAVSLMAVIITVCFWFQFFSHKTLYAAFPIPNVGGIVINAPKIDGVNFSMNASSTQTDLQTSWPTANLKADTMQFPDGFTLNKTVDVSATPLASLGISKLIIKFTVQNTNSAINGSLQISGIQSDQTTFTTGYDDSGNAIFTDSSGAVKPLASVSDITFNNLTNVSLNTHSFQINGFDWSKASIEIIAADRNGNPIAP